MKRNPLQAVSAISRRRALQYGVSLPVIASRATATPMSSLNETEELSRRVDQVFEEQQLRSVLLTVLDHGEPLLTRAWGHLG